ncbi:MAG: glycosyltransferase family 4 protein [Rickettsiales bacterium]
MTRVWIINHFAVPPGESGGTRHFSLARELQKHGFTPTIIAAASHYQTGKPRPLPEGAKAQLQTIQDVPFLWLRARIFGKSALQRLIAMLSFAWDILTNAPRRHLDAPDIIIASSPDLFTATAGCFLARHLKIPFVLEVRDLWPDSLIELTNHSPLNPIILLMRLLERYVYARADRIVTLLSDATPYFVSRGARAEQVVVIPNGVDAQLLAPPQAFEREADAPFTIVYAGAHGVPNQLDTLLNAAIALKNEPVRFVFIGDGICKPTLVARADAAQLSNVLFIAPVAKNDIAAKLAKADAFHLEFKDAALYRFGVSPNKLYDYLLAARPVLYGANVPTNPVVLADAGYALPPGDSAALVAAIQKLMALPEAERAAMGERGRDYVLAHHDFTVLGKTLADMLKSLNS